ncbi:MAG: SdpI family protein [Pannonibacter sp.]
MSESPSLMADTSRPDTLGAAGFVGLGLIAGLTLAGFLLLPAEASLPVHFDLTGQADSYLGRDIALLLLPAISLILTLGAMALTRYAPAEAVRAGRAAMAVAVVGMIWLFALCQTIILSAGAGLEVNVPRLICVALGLFLMLLGNVLPKTQPNPYAGLRLPTTLRDPVAWRQANRFAGMAFATGGAALIVIAAMTGDGRILGLALLAAAILPALASLLNVLWLTKR